MKSDIAILGVGSLGKILLNNCYKYDKWNNIHIFDNDVVDKYNLSYHKKYVGMKKIYACADEFSNKIIPHDEYVTNENLNKIRKILNKCVHVFDCRDIFDNLKWPLIKLFINNNRLFISCSNKDRFKYEFESSYISHINETTISVLIQNFIKNLDNNTEKILHNKNAALVINTIGHVDVIDSSQYLFSKKNIKKINCIINDFNIDTLHFKIEDGLYILFDEKISGDISNIHQILSSIEKKCKNFPAIFISYQIKNTTLIIKIINQVGGA